MHQLAAQPMCPKSGCVREGGFEGLRAFAFPNIPGQSVILLRGEMAAQPMCPKSVLNK